MLLSAAHCAGVFIENGIYLGGNTADGAGSLRFRVEKELAHPGYGALSCQRILLIVLHISTKPDNSIRGSLFPTDPVSDADGEYNSSIPVKPNTYHIDLI